MPFRKASERLVQAGVEILIADPDEVLRQGIRSERAAVRPAAAKSAVNDCSAGIAVMATLTIRQLPDRVKERLRIRAAENGRSMEAEARVILEEALVQPEKVDLSWVEALIDLGNKHGGIELEIPPREIEPAWTFDEP